MTDYFIAMIDLGVISLDFTTLASSYPDMRWASEEPFAPVITVIRVPCSSLVEYASHAFRFANTMLWGNLSASVFAPDSALPVVMKKIAEKELYYGSVVINSSTLVGYNFRAYWGGPQGANTLTDAQSGNNLRSVLITSLICTNLLS
jgi:acyl-CoA reductase-like NAD-dependent aldehyde dehydrogenase